MPLIHSKTPKAFKKNIETEMKHGKPQKQAVAIAYKMSGEHKADGGEMCAHGGRMHCNMGCYDDGGKVSDQDTLGTIIGYPGSPPPKPKSYAEGGAIGNKQRHENEKGVHKSSMLYPGRSSAGAELRDPSMSKEDEMDKMEAVKGKHEGVLKEMRSMKKPHLYAHGGSVAAAQDQERIKGVHKGMNTASSGNSYAGSMAKSGQHENSGYDLMLSKNKHKKVLEEMKSMKKPELMAEGGAIEGGAIEDGEPEMDEELHHAIGGELMDALERKDKKAIMQALEAAIMSCKDKE